MRIAVSGSHATGKSTLVAELAHLLPGAAMVEEAYFTLLDEGTDFADSPDASDYERMCERACEQLASTSDAKVVFDRTPADYLAYLVALGENVAGTELVARTRNAVAALDLIVFVPIEVPDVIDGAERPRLRRVVDRALRELWMDDAWGWGFRAVKVTGSPSDRARQVIASLPNA